MAQSGYTPILIYASSTPGALPSAANLTSSASGAELAINYADGKLYFKNSSGVVTLLAGSSSGPAGGSNTQVQYNSSGVLAGSSNMTFDGTSLTLGGNPTISAGTANGVLYLNGSKVATSGSALTFDGTTATTPRLALGGTTLPAAGTATLFSRSSDNNTYLQTGSGNSFLVLDGSQNTMFQASPTLLGFNINNSEQMRLTSTGLGIGTTSPSYKLDVVGTGSIISATRSDTSRADIIVTNSGGTVSFGINNSTGSWLTDGLGYYGYILGPSSASYGLQFGVGASNTAAVTIAPSGNVGIGTSSPGQKLVISGSGAQRFDIIDTGGATGRVSTAGGTVFVGTTTNHPLSLFTNDVGRVLIDSSGNLGLGVAPSAWSGAIGFQLANGSVIASAGRYFYMGANTYFNGSWRYTTSSGGAARYDMDGSHAWYTAPSGTAGNAITFTQAMTLDASGNLAVGNTSSGSFASETATRLSVGTGSGETGLTLYTGSASYGQILWADGTSGAATYSGILRYDHSINAMQFYTNGLNERARITSGGNLLIGTTTESGSGRLRVVDSIRVADSTSETNALLTTVSSTASTIETRYSTPLILGTGATERARITSGGEFLIGQTSGGARLNITAAASQNAVNIVLPSDNYLGATIHSTATSGDNQFMAFGTEASFTTRGSIDYNRAGGLTRYNTTSDYRAKDIIGLVQNTGATIDALKVYEGVMKGATQARPMLIAHEAQAHAPYAVSGVKDEVNEDGTPKFQQIDVSSLVPLLLAEIQSLRQRVALLEGN